MRHVLKAALAANWPPGSHAHGGTAAAGVPPQMSVAGTRLAPDGGRHHLGQTGVPRIITPEDRRRRMAGRIRQEDIAAVRERSPIADVIGEYLQLRPAGGGSLKGLCPFHDEKTPSFNVTPAKELWHCFSCGAGGDVIKFVQDMEHLSFTETIERLAARAGIELRYEQGGYVPGQESGQRRRLADAHRAAQEFYADRLGAPDAGPARQFLSERGFELADAGRFGVGY